MHPHHPAIEESGSGTITYRDLAVLAERLRDRLHHLGVRRGDRVGLYLRKSIDAVIAIFRILKAGAAYVPVDPHAPPSRNAFILHDCSVKAAVMEARFAAGLRGEMARLAECPPSLLLEGVGGGLPLRQALARPEAQEPAPPVEGVAAAPDDLAYILYTSGSTGRPKGVMLSHRNATSFVEWASDTFAPHGDDRFSAHAPFHFDLSILDIFLAVKHGATLVLIGDEVGKDPARLASLIAQARLSIWYSAPSILSLLAQYGDLPRHDYAALRLVLFAGEVFPVKYLRLLTSLLPGPRYFNLYGPTETNVCTYCEIPTPIAADRTEPFPIGQACAHLHTRVVDEQGRDVPAGLYGHPAVREVAVIARLHEESGVQITAFLGCRDGQRPSLIELKRFCAERLPLYMVPDRFSVQESLPKTSTEKIDYQRLQEMA